MTKLTIDQLNDAFDSRQVGKMLALQNVRYCQAGWMEIRDVLIAAKSHSNLRDSVRDTFFEKCAYPELVDEMRRATGRFEAQVISLKDAPQQGKPVKEKVRKAARADKDRAVHASMQGSSSGAGQQSKRQRKKA